VADDPEVRLETLEESTVAAELAALGYRLTQIDGGERILHSAITEKFTLTSSGALEPLTADSTKPIAQTRSHAGIGKTRRFVFDMP
jgi:hypothetical protein